MSNSTAPLLPPAIQEIDSLVIGVYADIIVEEYTTRKAFETVLVSVAKPFSYSQLVHRTRVGVHDHIRRRGKAAAKHVFYGFIHSFF